MIMNKVKPSSHGHQKIPLQNIPKSNLFTRCPLFGVKEKVQNWDLTKNQTHSSLTGKNCTHPCSPV